MRISFGLPLILLLAVVGAQDEACNGVSYSCNTATYTANSPLEQSLNAIITDLEQNTYSKGTNSGTNVVYNNYISNPAAYGEGVCLPLDAAECTVCLTVCANCILSACGNTVGARAQTSNNVCYMRFETYKFY